MSNPWKLFAAIFLTLELALQGICNAQIANVETTSWSVSESSRTAHRTKWRQADTVIRDYMLTTDGTTPLDLSPTNVVVTWDVMAYTNITEQWIAATGLVVNGTSGHIRVRLSPAESNIQTGYYWGFVAALQVAGTNITNRLCTVPQVIEVRYSPDNRYTSFHGPLTYEVPGGSTVDTTARAWIAVVSNTADRALETGSLAYVVAESAALTGSGAYVQAQIAQTTGAAAMARADAAYELAESLTGGVVRTVGGYYNRDWFTLSFDPWEYTTDEIAATQVFNSVYAKQIVYSDEAGRLIQANIWRISNPTTSISHVAITNASIIGTNDDYVVVWDEGLSVGDSAIIASTFGTITRTSVLTYAGASASTSWIWHADVTDSLRDHINTQAAIRVAGIGDTNDLRLFLPGDGTFVRDTNCWAADLDLTCASPYNTEDYTCRAGTLVTPQHIIYAAHYTAPTGTQLIFVGRTNDYYWRTLVAQRTVAIWLGARMLKGSETDLALGVLDSPLPASIAPAQVLSTNDLPRLLGYIGFLSGSKVDLVFLNRDSHALPASTYTPVDTWGQGVISVRGTEWGALRSGDSGKPFFLCIGTNIVLLGTASGPLAISSVTARLRHIESTMAALGGSVYTNVTRVDLDDWTYYNALPLPPEEEGE